MTDHVAAPHLPEDPFADGGLAHYGTRLRRGETTAVATVEACLTRIELLNPALLAFEHVAAEQALSAAREIDSLISLGIDLGSVMGVPVALKDLFAVDGMPMTAGSAVDVTDLVGAEGSFVKQLRRCGCIILGTCKTVEFARGASGVNRVRGTPRNPWDAAIPRVPGGSSSGSAVALSAGMCGFTIGTDTGGSVRGPAALCGAFGLKTTHGLWATDGLYPNAPSFDTIGPITRTAADAALVFEALSGQPVPESPPIDRLRIGKPVDHFYDELDPGVADCMSAALEALASAGATIEEITIPEAQERQAFVDKICTVEFIANLGRERFQAESERLDPLTVARARPGLDVQATEYVEMVLRHQRRRRQYARRIAGFDAWITPTCRVPASDLATAMNSLNDTMRVEAQLGINTHLVSYFGLCATTSPIQALGAATLPVGLQTICAGGRDETCLAIAVAFENLFGAPQSADVSGFLQSRPVSDRTV